MPSFDQWDILVRAAAVVAAAVGVALPGGWGRRARPLARRPWAAAAVVACLSLLVNGAVAVRHGIPRPRVHDEFSYLLAADTFARGRVTNPTPACPDSFQSPHVLLRPTYASKYPPGQGVALAAGQLLGRPVYGVWLSCAAAAVAVWWMALAFVPAEWALLAGGVAAVHPLLVDWGHVYWGGAVAACGGALVVGGWGRLMRGIAAETGCAAKPVFEGPRRPGSDGNRSGSSRSLRHRLGWQGLWEVMPALLLGAGLVVLANTRPYEGLIFSLPLLVSLAWRRPPARAIVAVLVPLAIGGAATAGYDWRVTGSPVRLPIAAYAAQFDVYPKFWFQPTRPVAPAYPNAQMAEVHTVKERGRYDSMRTAHGRWSAAVDRARLLVEMHARPAVLLVPLAAAVVVAVTDRRTRWVWAAVVATYAGLMAENWFLPHYAAPATPAVLLLIVLGWRWLADAPDRPAGRLAARVGRGVLAGFVVAALLSAAAPDDPDLRRFTRDDLLAETPALRSGRHLVFVRYAADHPVEDEWVYNGADLAAAPILWAHAMGDAADAAVSAAYAPRQTWVLTVGKATHTITAVGQAFLPVTGGGTPPPVPVAAMRGTPDNSARP